MALIDFHCHLDLYPDPVAVANQAMAEGVYALSVTTTPSAFLGTCALVPNDGRIRTALGLHPELAASRSYELPLFEKLLHKTNYVGEVGLDGSSPHRDTLDTQARILSDIFNMCAVVGGKTLSIHSRGASELLLDLIEFEPEAGRFVLHWFSAKPALVERAAQLGCWFSVGSSMLTSKAGRSAFEAMPVDRILPETDGPFGKVHGRLAYPWDTSAVYRLVAELWQCNPEQVEIDFTKNFKFLTSLSHELTVRSREL